MTVNDVKVYQLQANGFETKPYLLRVGNISKRFTAGNMKKKNNLMERYTVVLLNIILLILVILQRFINI